jgi:hypothetical protein
MGQLELQTLAGAHLRIHELTGLGSPELHRVALSIDCREFDHGAVWVSLTEGEARAVAEALSEMNTWV